jgi:hypothetical protein
MNYDNRVLGRAGARDLTTKETKAVSGALPTDTVCTFDEKSGFLDGDASIGEC